MMDDLTIVYYTANRPSPSLMRAVIKQLLVASDGIPIISVSHKPMNLGHNICVGDIGYSVWNVFWQMLQGVKAATTQYVAMAEDDVLYPREHYHTRYPDPGSFLYNMNRWGLFTWMNPPYLFNYKPNRMIASQMSCDREVLIEVLESRFKRWPSPESLPRHRLRFFGEPGREKVERGLGEKRQKSDTFWSSIPSLVFNHENSIGFDSQGRRKALGKLRSDWLLGWGSAEDMIKLCKGETA